MRELTFVMSVISLLLASLLAGCAHGRYHARVSDADPGKRLFICADSGGSNGNRQRAWKLHLQELSDETGMAITVCHYPPGTSKWNKIEHRLFSIISLNWKGKPLVNYETVVNLIGGTRTRSGLSQGGPRHQPV